MPDHIDDLKTFYEIINRSSESECFRFMSYIVMKLQHIHDEEVLKVSGYEPN